MRKNLGKRVLTLTLLVSMLLMSMQAAFASDDWYSYTYNYWNDPVESPDTYSVTSVMFGKDFGDEVGNLNNPSGLFVVENHVFIVDTGNSRIIELQKVDGSYELVRIISHLQVSKQLADIMAIDGGAITLTFNNPEDIFVRPSTPEYRAETYNAYLGELYEDPNAVIPAETEDAGTETAEVGTETAEAETEDATEEVETSTEEAATTEENEATVDTTETAVTSSSEGEEDGEASEDGEATEGAESGEDATSTEEGQAPATGEGNSTPAPAPVVWRENVVKKELDLDYDFYIADTQNHRIIHCDYNLNVIDVTSNPEDDTIADNFIFLPSKLVVDTANRLYVQATNVNSGLMEFDKSGTFTSYCGANKVEVSIAQKVWRKLQTKEQKDRSVQYVPTEYNNISLDSKGFIYVTTSTLDDDDLWSGTATPVRKLNSMGSDILVRNGNQYPSGDQTWGTAGNVSGASAFVDVIAFANDTYACLDRTRGRIFTYDFQGNMLCAFGNYGQYSGCFTFPTAMDNLGEETILVLDKYGSLTEFSMTDYGKLINEALAHYKIGHYDESAEVWKEVLKFNGNYELAYVGIGRALLRQNKYKEAMGYFENARDDSNYSKAFKHYREEVVEKYIVWALVVLAVLIIVPKVVRGIKNLRKEIKES